MARRWMCAILVFALAIGLWHVASITYDPMYGASSLEENEKVSQSIDEDEGTLTLWYTDEALSDYLTSVALSFQKDLGVKVNLELKDGVDFLEQINAVSIQTEENRTQAMPDLYITSHDNLLRAYLSGLASPIIDSQNVMESSAFSDTAKHAVSCYGSIVGYPLYFETNFFLYNKTYMAAIAQTKIEADADLAEGEAAAKALEESENSAQADKEESKKKDSADDSSDTSDATEEETDESNESADGDDDNPMGDEESGVSQEVLNKLSTMIPETLDDITTFANNYDAPEAVEAVFKWDVTDIFYNYFFVGNYMDVGGENGDNAAVFNIYNQQSVECLKAYQGMNQFITMDSKEDTYERILQDFIDGKMVFTVATTDALAKMSEAKKSGQFEYEYGVTMLPDINSLLKTRGLSVTDAVAINGYSRKQEMANVLATYISAVKSDELYEKSGKIPCKENTAFEEPEIKNVYKEYKKSMPLPKMVEAANYWVQLEIAFTKVWKGADPDEILKELSDTIGAQIEEIKANLPTQESFGAGAGKFIQ